MKTGKNEQMTINYIHQQRENNEKLRKRQHRLRYNLTWHDTLTRRKALYSHTKLQPRTKAFPKALF